MPTLSIISTNVTNSIISTGSPAGADSAATPQVLIMVLGVIMLGVVIMISIRSKIARRQDETPTPRERLKQIKTEARAREGGFAAEASMLDTAQRLAGQLDAKAERLDQLIAEADARIASLGALEARGAAAVDPYGNGTGEASGPGGASSRASAGGGASGGGGGDPVTEAVYRLADDGHDVLEIARELGEQTGKVELILALREGA